MVRRLDERSGPCRLGGEHVNAERAEYLDLFVVVMAREQTRRDLFCAHFTCPGHVRLGDISECKSGQ